MKQLSTTSPISYTYTHIDREEREKNSFYIPGLGWEIQGVA